MESSRGSAVLHKAKPPISDGREPPTVVVINRESAARLPPMAALWPRVDGYEILSVIGSGGMGIVYKARHRELNRLVAIKTLRGTAFSDMEFRDRFQSEAEAVARLQHPNIIQVFEVGSIESSSGKLASPFIALEYVDGGNLSSRTSKPQSPRSAAEMVLMVARAVHAAHQVGIVHRDLKPANVLLTRQGQPKVADFGLAKQLGAGTQEKAGERFVTAAGTVVGTPEYMSPEQATGAAPTPAMDVYAIGVMLYELLTARVPFQAATPIETIHLVMEQEPVSPRRLQPELPRDIETICLKCLEKDPDRRYASAEDLAKDLQLFLQHRPIHARRQSEWERMRRWCQRNPLPAASLATAVIVFLAGFSLVTYSYLKAEEARQEAIQREKAERWERYRAVIAASGSAMQVFNVNVAKRNLNTAPDEYRDWEWRHLHSRLDLAKEVRPFEQNQLHMETAPFGRRWMMTVQNDATVRLTSFSDANDTRTIHPPAGWSDPRINPDDSTMVFRVADGRMGIWDVETGQAIAEIGVPGVQLDCHAFCSDRRVLFTTSKDLTVRQWDLRTGQLIKSTHFDRLIYHAYVISPDGRYIGWRDNKHRVVRIGDLETGREIAEFPGHSPEIYSIVFSPSADKAVTTDGFPNNTVRLWDVKTGRLRELGRYGNVISSVAYSNDGRRIAASSRDQVVRLWDGETGQPIATLKDHNGPVNSIAFSPDSKRLASASEDHTVRLWDAETGDLLAVLHGHESDVDRVVFSTDGKLVVSTSADLTMRIWDVQSLEMHGVLHGHESFIYAVAAHPDNSRVATASWDGTARIWDSTNGREIHKLPHGKDAIVTSVAFHPLGKTLVSRARDAVRLWDVDTGRELHCWPAKVNSFHDTTVAINHRGNLIATGCEPNRVRIWDLQSREEYAVLDGHQSEVRDLAFSPDDRWLATGGDDGECAIRVWDVEQRKLLHVLTGHEQGVFGLAFNDSGTLLASASTDGTVRLWSTATWSEIALLKHSSRVYGVAFSREGTRLACACGDNSIRFWDTRTFQEVADLRGHRQYVHHLVFSPDGTRLISGSGDRTARIWDTIPLQHSARPLR